MKEIIELEINRLKFFPIMMFSIVMGLAGLTIAYQRFYEVFGFGETIAYALSYFSLSVFSLISFIYLFKTLKYFKEVKAEFLHPVRINFFPASAISLLLLSIVFRDMHADFSYYLFVIGIVMQTIFTFYTISFWINKNLELNHSSPAWFIPVVANVVVPISGHGLVDIDILMYYFSIGMFFWVILTAVLLNRIIFHHQLAEKFMPTLFIFIAPPAIGFIAYIRMNGGDFDILASFLYNIGLFFVFLIFFMYKNFTDLKFFISWWAFTFPLTAITLASILAYKLSYISIYKYFSYFFLFVSTIIILLVAFVSIQNILRGKICIKE